MGGRLGRECRVMGDAKECYDGGSFSETTDKACSSDSSLMRKAIDLPPPPWLASLSPRLHLPPDLDARCFDVCVIYLLAATVFSVCFGMLGRGHLAPASLVDGMVRMTHLHTTCLLKWLR